MTNNEKELIQIIREAPDPVKAMETSTSILARFAAGEDPQSIAASYGLELTDIASAVQA